MYAQLFVDSMVAINMVVCLYLASMLVVWIRRSLPDGALKLQCHLMISAFFPTMMIISLSHASWAAAPWMAYALFWSELTFTVAVGPLILALCCGGIGFPRLLLALSLSAVVALLLGLSGFDWLIVFVPMAFTLTALALGYGLQQGDSSKLREHILTIALIIHCAQITRFLGRDIDWLKEIVPLTATVVGLAYLGWLFLLRYRQVLGGNRLALSPRVFSELDLYVRDSQSYRNPDLSVAGLARELRLPSYLVSQAINQHAGRFNDYINAYRVQAFLQDYSPQAKVEPLAYRAGFKSRSAFYRAFKASTGKSPLQYFSLPCPDL